jgi:hypothetical protein
MFDPRPDAVRLPIRKLKAGRDGVGPAFWKSKSCRDAVRHTFRKLESRRDVVRHAFRKLESRRDVVRHAFRKLKTDRDGVRCGFRNPESCHDHVAPMFQKLKPHPDGVPAPLRISKPEEHLFHPPKRNGEEASSYISRKNRHGRRPRRESDCFPRDGSPRPCRIRSEGHHARGGKAGQGRPSSPRRANVD